MSFKDSTGNFFLRGSTGNLVRQILPGYFFMEIKNAFSSKYPRRSQISMSYPTTAPSPDLPWTIISQLAIIVGRRSSVSLTLLFRSILLPSSPPPPAAMPPAGSLAADQLSFFETNGERADRSLMPISSTSLSWSPGNRSRMSLLVSKQEP